MAAGGGSQRVSVPQCDRRVLLFNHVRHETHENGQVNGKW